MFSGETQEIPPGIGSFSYVDVRDVAAIHAWCAEHPKESANHRYLMAVGRAPPQAAADILRKAYPERKPLIPEGELGKDYSPDFSWPENGLSFDSSPAEKAIGRSFIGFEKSILDTAKVFEKYL